MATALHNRNTVPYHESAQITSTVLAENIYVGLRSANLRTDFLSVDLSPRI